MRGDVASATYAAYRVLGWGFESAARGYGDACA